ncbi:plasmid maintenance system antidote protein [Mucilaginibacter conchicola]|uniref:Plasmid maintenance system antidote protein n=1 Tax=Mucilaginibacter conchicola TaxID=2303333 RepID=A0A372NRG2_9SPHI|nr:plasmid maintenance system antidote protein [Mucilaginibacter conchicola]RFZ91220.1 plasmid maintenance system antidote protein [Mucilaginibacter conchicola]
MESKLEKYKGIHPGIILERELQKRNLRKGPFALSLEVYPQTLNEITKGRRALTPEQSLKIDRALALEEGTMFLLQAYYEIDKARLKLNAGNYPDLGDIAKALFWDTDFEKIDWEKKYKTVIRRVFERGGEKEKEAVLRFYGQDKIKEVIGKSIFKDNQLSIPGHKLTK